MKLINLNEDLDYQQVRSSLLPPQPNKTDFQAGNQVLHQIYNHILKGNSQLSQALKNGYFTFLDVLKAIRYDRCINAGHRDLGATYLEQTLSTAVTEIIPPEQINNVRALIGLDPLD